MRVKIGDTAMTRACPSALPPAIVRMLPRKLEEQGRSFIKARRIFVSARLTITSSSSCRGKGRCGQHEGIDIRASIDGYTFAITNPARANANPQPT